MRFLTRLFLWGAITALLTQPLAAQQKGFVFRRLPDPSLFIKQTSPSFSQPSPVSLRGPWTQINGKSAALFAKKEKFAAMALPGISLQLQKLVAVAMAEDKLKSSLPKAKNLRLRDHPLIMTINAEDLKALAAKIATIKDRTAKEALVRALYPLALARPEMKDLVIDNLKILAKQVYVLGDGHQALAITAYSHLTDKSGWEQFMRNEFFPAQRVGRNYKTLILLSKGAFDQANLSLKLKAAAVSKQRKI